MRLRRSGRGRRDGICLFTDLIIRTATHLVQEYLRESIECARRGTVAWDVLRGVMNISLSAEETGVTA